MEIPARKFIAVEKMVNNMNHLEQYVESIINYTSRYNISLSISYAPDNLIGKYVKYPSYGDFAETYILRSYGKWWKESEAYQSEYMPQDVDSLGAEDYITLGFETAVVPRDVCIYETYNPGSVVRIWGRYNTLPWKLLWQGEAQTCTEESRKFHPKIRGLNCLVNQIRLELNQSHLKYHTSIDAVLLGGFEPKLSLHGILANDLLNWPMREDGLDEPGTDQVVPDVDSDKIDHFSRLPYEIMLQIFQYLDLRSLSRCAQVNKKWYEATLDPVLYQNLSLKQYWHKVNGNTLDYFSVRAVGVRKLDLSWCDSEEKSFQDDFVIFAHSCCSQVTHLSLNHCTFVNNVILQEIASFKEITELRLRGTKSANTLGYQELSKLQKLVTLDLSLTSVHEVALAAILKANPNLKHLLLDFCESVERFDDIVDMLPTYNPQLRTWSSFKTSALTSVGVRHFARCPNLRELDLGWCFLFGDAGDSLAAIAENCPQLRRLVISQWRGVTDQVLFPIIVSCKELTQLDLLGIKSISSDICQTALMTLPRLRLLDISFCDSVSNEQVEYWRQHFPNVTIQRSCQYVVYDYLN